MSELGPFAPSPSNWGPAGLSRDGWRPLREGDAIYCGVQFVDRRGAVRGVDRRREPRPCTGWMGRLGPKFTAAWTRPKGTGTHPAPGPVLYLQCPNKNCGQLHELLYLTAASEAA